jgi:two-component system sensor histidine kinase YesM
MSVKRNIRGFFKPLFFRLKTRMMLFFILLVLLITSMISTISYVNHKETLERSVSDITGMMVNSLDWSLNLLLSNTEELSNMLRHSKEIQTSQIMSPEDISQYFEYTRSIRNLVTNITSSFGYVKMIYVANDAFEYYQQSSQWVFKMDLKYLQNERLQNAFREKPTTGVWLLGSELKIPGLPREDCLLYVQRILNLNSLKPIGHLVMGVDMAVFDAMLLPRPNTEYVLAVMNEDHLLYLSDRSLNNPDLADTLRLNAGKDVVEIDGLSYLVNQTRNAVTGWYIIVLTPYAQIMHGISTLQRVTFTLSIFAVILAFVLSTVMSGRIIRPIRMISKVFDDISHKRPVSESSFDRNDEIGRIGLDCLRLFKENQDLNDKLYESTIKEKEAELMMLQSQINPHFLYNTLDTIFWMAEKAHEPNISKIALSLSQLFRLGLNKGQKLTTIENELLHVKSYIEIQNIRYHNKFDVVYDVAEDLYPESIIRMLIQPIIENAIYHGLEPKKERGHVRISGVRDGRDIVLTVSDDGVGIDNMDALGKGYALRNINERIKLFYGNEYGLDFQSGSNLGTTIILRVAAIDGGCHV